MKRKEMIGSIIDLLEEDTEITSKLIDDIEFRLKSIIDEIETGVNAAKDHLEGINSIEGLDSVNDCHKELDSLSNDLY